MKNGTLPVSILLYIILIYYLTKVVMTMSNFEKGTELVATNPVILCIPNDCIKLVITATIYDGKEMHEATSIMGVQDIVEARIQGEEWESENVRYCLTDKAKEILGK
jgi:hypothetical protein